MPVILADRGLEERFVLAVPQCRPLEERHRLVEDGAIARHVDVVGGRVWEPHAVVGDPRAHAAAGVREPPVLHVAVGELASRRAKQVARVRSGRETVSAMTSWS